MSSSFQKLFRGSAAPARAKFLARQIEHHRKDAFRAFLFAAGRDARPTAYVQGRETPYDGAILIWGAVTPEGHHAVREQTGLYDILSIETICQDLSAWRNAEYARLLQDRLRWASELFEGLQLPP